MPKQLENGAYIDYTDPVVTPYILNLGPPGGPGGPGGTGVLDDPDPLGSTYNPSNPNSNNSFVALPDGKNYIVSSSGEIIGVYE